ncbi:carboxypeptidase-like regulatory domain-containing protein [Paraburkholderia sp.]|uniref:carboxypeptidase-like regulatory domain-containing protein n=1 Tax=Paraburkholderia sp. TaxID=1926495 RepID=UPI003D6FDCC7
MNQQNTQRGRTRGKLAAGAMAALLTLGMGVAGGAYAQASDVAGGTTSDQTSAGNTNGGGLPQVQHQGDVAYTSGGVGQDESKALQRAQSHWPLSLRFTGPGSDFLADVRVRVVDAHDDQVLAATSRGPYMLVRLSPGRYTVHAAYEGHDQTRAVTVPAKGTARADFSWHTQ